MRPVYQLSRDSDGRVSAALAGQLDALQGFAEGPGPDASPRELLRYSTSGLIVALKAAERITSTHAAIGRPWSAARRAAQERRG